MRFCWLHFSKVLALLLLSVSLNLSSTELFNEREYQIKTAYMLNFFKFTQWKNSKNSANFLFCSTNQDYTNVAKVRLKSKSVQGKDLAILTVSPSEEQHCDALFVTKVESEQWQNYLTNSEHSNTLIIGERSGFAKKFGHIKFFQINNKLRFQVNITALKQDRLKMSPQLLRLASIVKHNRDVQGLKKGAKK